MEIKSKLCMQKGEFIWKIVVCLTEQSNYSKGKNLRTITTIKTSSSPCILASFFSFTVDELYVLEFQLWREIDLTLSFLNPKFLTKVSLVQPDLDVHF